MRLLLFGMGSRGDVQPLIALGKGLQAAGYEVAVAAGINFRDMIDAAGLDFEAINVDIEAYMQSEIGKTWLNDSSRNPRRELQNMKLMADGIAGTVTDDILRMIERADVLFSGVLTVEAMETVARQQGKPHIVALMAPFAPTRSGAAGLQALFPRGENILNRWWGYAVEAMLYTVLKGPSNEVRHRLNLPESTRGDFMRAWNRTPTIIGASPMVVPPPDDWPDHIHVTGYWHMPVEPDWQPSEALRAFLEAGPAPVYIGFGSMSNRDPQGTTRLMIEALQRAGQRGIIYGGWAGLHSDDLPASVYLLDGAPHSWLFPRCAAVIHHGGAGTTGTALQSGRPSLIVAHIGDQPYWGRRVNELGAGPAPLKRHELNVDNLSEAIHTMVIDQAMQARAAELGARIRSEDGVGEAVRVVQSILDQPGYSSRK